MKEYDKIETLRCRSEDGNKALILNTFRNDTVKYLANLEWIWTEKIDGTTIRVMWDGHTITFGGRTDNAQIPVDLINYLRAKFDNTEAEELFEQLFGDKEVILFGEGYGRKIQKAGSSYIPDGVSFILFDVIVGDNYQPRESVESLAKTFGIDVVPIVGCGTLIEAEDYVKSNPKSVVGSCDMEGIVCRPKIELLSRCGKRLIVKIKWCDYK